MRPVLAIALVAALLAAGCSTRVVPPTPTSPPTSSDGIPDLTSVLGLFLYDTASGGAERYTEQQARAWLSPNGTYVTWTDLNFATVVHRAGGTREVGPLTVWARISDNGTGLELASGEARTRDLVSGETRETRPIAPGPREGALWSGASDDLRVLGAELAGERALSCSNELFLRTPALGSMRGCHLRVAPDGRAGWTDSTGVHVRHPNGTVEDVAGPGSGDVANSTYVAHENPVFTANGIVMLRITGGSEIVRTEVVDEDGAALAKVLGPRRVALHDVSLDGRFLLLRTFDR